MNEWERLRRQAERVKQQFPKGTRIQLDSMAGEPDMPPGLKGEVAFVDDIGQIHMKWENGRSLALNVDEDSFTVLSVPKKKRDDMSR